MSDKDVLTTLGFDSISQEELDALRAENERLRTAFNDQSQRLQLALAENERLQGLLEGAGKAAVGMLDTRDREIERLRAALQSIIDGENHQTQKEVIRLACRALGSANCQ